MRWVPLGWGVPHPNGTCWLWSGQPVKKCSFQAPAVYSTKYKKGHSIMFKMSWDSLLQKNHPCRFISLGSLNCCLFNEYLVFQMQAVSGILLYKWFYLAVRKYIRRLGGEITFLQ